MSPPTRLALLVEDDVATRSALATILGVRGYGVIETESLAEARAAIAKTDKLDVILCDLGLPDGDGMELLEELSESPRDLQMVVLTGQRSIERAVHAMHLGAADFLSKPLQPEVLRLTMERLERRISDAREQRKLRAHLARLGSYQGMVGGSPQMRQVYEMVERAAPSRIPVFIRGESGTGKELLARAIHGVSRRRDKPFVAINCGAIPASLVESELFGHEKGAFTGASARRKGVFVEADGGTLFLDELAEMPLDDQVKLLRVLEQRVVRPVGGARDIPVDVRVISATNRDPAESVASGRLREDLFFRLHVFPMQLPPLRDRTGDVPMLARHLVEIVAKEEGGEPLPVDEDALAALVAHTWPGNVRELRNVMARAWLLANGEPIGVHHLGLPVATTTASLPTATQPNVASSADNSETVIALPFGCTLEEAERRIVEVYLSFYEGHRDKTSRALGVTPKTLYNKLKAWGVQPPRRG